MPVTILLIPLVLFVLVVLFAITYKAKGLKTALITTGVALVISSILYAALIAAIVNAMD